MEKQTRKTPQGLKPNISFAFFAARLKSCPDTKHMFSRVHTQIIFAGVILLSAGLGAQQTAPSAMNPALQMAQKVDLHYNQLHSLKSSFTESYEGLGMRRTESGTLLLLKPGRMKWEYNEPAGKIFLLDGTFAWFYSPGDSQVQRILAKQLNDLRSPLRFLLGHTKLEKELSNLTLRPAANGQFTLTGQPVGQEKRLSRLTLTVTADGTITGIEMEETDGALTRFTFTGEQPNVTFPAGTFRFTPPKGVPIVDALSPV
jgi:outer membrane lipoprotein carrier protein